MPEIVKLKFRTSYLIAGKENYYLFDYKIRLHR